MLVVQSALPAASLPGGDIRFGGFCAWITWFLKHFCLGFESLVKIPYAPPVRSFVAHGLTVAGCSALNT